MTNSALVVGSPLPIIHGSELHSFRVTQPFIHLIEFAMEVANNEGSPNVVKSVWATLLYTIWSWFSNNVALEALSVLVQTD